MVLIDRIVVADRFRSECSTSVQQSERSPRASLLGNKERRILLLVSEGKLKNANKTMTKHLFFFCKMQSLLNVNSEGGKMIVAQVAPLTITFILKRKRAEFASTKPS